MVKLTIKTVQNKASILSTTYPHTSINNPQPTTRNPQVFSVDASENETIADVKNKIKDSQGFPVEVQKIIYAGEPGCLRYMELCPDMDGCVSVDVDRLVIDVIRKGIGRWDYGGAT
jgi:hypothetical protein